VNGKPPGRDGHRATLPAGPQLRYYPKKDLEGWQDHCVLQELFQLKLSELSRKPLDFKGVTRTNLRLITLSGGENSASPADRFVSIGSLVPGLVHVNTFTRNATEELIREISSEVV